MTLADLVSADRLIVPLEETTLQGAAGALVERLIDSGSVARPDRLRERIGEEWGEDVVSLSDRAFLLHYRTDTVSDLVLAMGIADRPIRREMGDESQQAPIVLMMLAPPRMAARYLQVLGAIARLLSRPDAVSLLSSARTAEALAALPIFGEVELPQQLAVRDMMSDQPRITAPDTDLREAAGLMVRDGLAALPVVDDTRLLVGMLSDRELLRDMLSIHLHSAHPRPADSPSRTRTVRDVMTRQVLAVSPDQPLAEVASLMVNKDVVGVPVVREGRLIGFLTRGDIVRKLIGS